MPDRIGARPRRATQSETDTSEKTHQAKGTVTCDLPANLNTFITPDGTFIISGTVTGFFTPAHG